MCRAGGRRCEYADALSSVRRKVRRSKQYQQTYPDAQHRMIKDAEKKWKNENPELVQAHMRTREKWQTKAAAMDVAELKRFEKLFPTNIKVADPATAREHTTRMYEENQASKEILTDEEWGTLRSYTQISHEVINAILRGNEKDLRHEWGPDSIERNTVRVDLMDSAMKKLHTESEPRVLYRHVLVPPGINAEDYAKRYWIEGERVRDDAFLSTTEDPAYIAGHIHKRSPSQYVVLQILSPQGISMQNEEHERIGQVQTFEKERLLPRGTNLRVLSQSRKRINVPPQRAAVHAQFAGAVSRIKPRTVTVVQLVDESLISRQ